MTIYYLYIKKHNKTGLKYLGQTTKDPWLYLGSGIHWKRHLKKHGFDVTTEILLKTESKDELRKTGLYFSKLFNIVSSNDWANLTEESGNGIGSEFSSKLQKKRIENGSLPQIFTSEKTRRWNLERAASGTHPFLKNKYVLENNKKMLDNGVHPFTDPVRMEYNRQVVSNKQKELSNTGKHNFQKIFVVNSQGKNMAISKDEYYAQTGDKDRWEYVSTSSKEAKRRKQ